MKTIENTTKTPLTYEQLLAGRLLITKFMGVRETTGHYDSYGTQVPCYWTDNDLYRTPTFRSPEKSFNNFLENAEYHSSFAWLMPVLEKLCRKEIGDGVTYVKYATPRTFGMINEETGQIMVRLDGFQLFQADTLIEATYLAIVDCLQWLSQAAR